MRIDIGLLGELERDKVSPLDLLVIYACRKAATGRDIKVFCQRPVGTPLYRLKEIVLEGWVEDITPPRSPLNGIGKAHLYKATEAGLRLIDKYILR